MRYEIVWDMPHHHTVFENHRKVSFNIMSCIHIVSGQKFIKNTKNSQFWQIERPEACSQTMLPDSSILIWQILVENANDLKKIKCDIFDDFQTLCMHKFARKV